MSAPTRDEIEKVKGRILMMLHTYNFAPVRHGMSLGEARGVIAAHTTQHCLDPSLPESSWIAIAEICLEKAALAAQQEAKKLQTLGQCG